MVTDGIFLLRNEDESVSPESILAWANGIFIFPAISSATLASLPLDVLSITCGGARPRLSILIMAQYCGSASFLIASTVAREPTNPLSSSPKATNKRVFWIGALFRDRYIWSIATI